MRVTQDDLFGDGLSLLEALGRRRYDLVLLDIGKSSCCFFFLVFCYLWAGVFGLFGEKPLLH